MIKMFGEMLSKDTKLKEKARKVKYHEEAVRLAAKMDMTPRNANRMTDN
jgi:hypothetical protein